MGVVGVHCCCGEGEGCGGRGGQGRCHLRPMRVSGERVGEGA